MSKRQTCIKFVFLITISSSICCAEETPISPSTLKQGDTLNYIKTISSSNSAYFLNFFKIQKTEVTRDKYYLGIFHSMDIVWVANRDMPILGDPVVLTIDSNGTLKITNSAGNHVVLFSDDGTDGSARVATLHDNGNFVFSELNSDGSTKKILWQSFDYPTDTLLPGMLLGSFGEKRAPRLSLTSCIAKYNPSSGAFTLDWDPMEQQLVISKRGVIVWKSGVLRDGSFQHITENLMKDSTLVFSAYRNSLSYAANNTAYWRLSEEGSLLFKFENKMVEETYYEPIPIMEMCYGYNTDHGCVQWLQPKCRSDMPTFISEQGFFRRVDTNEIELGFHYANASIGHGDCPTICWDDCDCVAYGKTYDIGCLFWKGKSQLKFEQEDYAPSLFVISTVAVSSQSSSLPTQPSAHEGDVKKENRRKWWIWKAIVPLCSLVITCLLVMIYWGKRKQRDKRDAAEKRKKKHLEEDETLLISIYRDEVENGLKLFDFHCLSEATNKFSVEQKLGQGGYGSVYKGTLPEGIEIAVKRLSKRSGQGLHEFKNEMKLISNLQHVNLVRLLGCCIQGKEKMLIYEYMPNKSLDYFLFDPSKRCHLDYKTRIQIIEGIAHGLHYLHELSRLMIIHRDLKASNILLDASFNPKIADFGMARLFKRNEVVANTKRIVGTYGYMSPEYAMEGIFSVKSDVFGFGILILEIVSGRKNNSFHHLDKYINLIGYAWELWQKETWIELVDPTLTGSCSMNPLRRIIHIGLLCVEESASNRPTVSEVISMLINENMPLPSVKRPAFLVSSTTTDKEYYSINGLSLSSVGAR